MIRTILSMKFKKRPSPYSIEMIFLTFLGIGLSPWAPGTLASLAVVPLLYGLSQLMIPTFFLIPILFLLIVGSGLVAQMVQKSCQIHDPPWIVIDEVIGMFVGFLFLPAPQWSDIFVLFGLFRFFDIVKVWPASFFDQKVKHGIGTILDDVVAGMYAGITNWLLHYTLLR